MKIGVTGASGVLGRILVNKLLNNENHCDISCFKGDICSKSDVREWLSNNKFDVIFHFAAIVATDHVKRDILSAYDVNIGGTINLMSGIRDQKHKAWFFYASTCHVYKSKNTPINENDAIDPISLYGITKYMGEKICYDVWENKNYNISVCMGRIFSFYHKTQKKPFLYPSIMERLNKENLDEPFFLHGSDSARDFLNAEEAVDIIIRLMEKKIEGVVNIGSGQGIKIKDFVQGLTDRKLKIAAGEGGDILIADISKLNRLLLSKTIVLDRIKD
jgi:UDP-glucose 4-epimerase